MNNIYKKFINCENLNKKSQFTNKQIHKFTQSKILKRQILKNKKKYSCSKILNSKIEIYRYKKLEISNIQKL